jgi:OOP family OmpA-OmpF porin
MVLLDRTALGGILGSGKNVTKESSMNSIRITLFAAALATALPALAQGTPQSPWYLGFGAGQGHLNVSGSDLTGTGNASIGNTASTYTVRGGVRFNPYMAVELGYYDLGKYDFHSGSGVANVDGEAKAKSFGVSLVGIVPLQMFDLYGRIGFARSELKINASAPLSATGYNNKDKQNEATYGVGGRWMFMPNLGVFVEWMKNDKIRVDSYLVGLDWKF